MSQVTPVSRTQMIYELINPSDRITFDAQDFRTATIATFIVGRGKYAAKLEDPDNDGENVPMFLFGGSEAWVKDKFGCTVSELMDSMDEDAVAKCLASFWIGDRDFMELASDKARAEVLDKRRSSMNDICGYAHRYGKALEAKVSKGSKA